MTPHTFDSTSDSTSDSFTLFIQSNSPGEISSWVKPICEETAARYPDVTIVVLLTPCQYASGQEFDEVSHFPGVSRVLKPVETVVAAKTFFKRTPCKGAYLVLGGDPLYARLLSYKYKIPAYAYTEHRHSPGRFFKQIFYKHVHGDLMGASLYYATHYATQLQPTLYSSAQPSDSQLRSNSMQASPSGTDNRPMLLFLMGSRPGHFKALIPFFNDVALSLKQWNPHLRCVLTPSPFISKTLIESVPKTGFELSELPATTLMRQATLVITIPGTNTAQAMYLNAPMMVFIPLNRPDLIVFDGLAGVIGMIPVLGSLFKKLVIWIVKRKKRLYALPNKMAGKPIVPELIDHLTVPGSADSIRKYIESPKLLEKQKAELAKFTPSKAVVETILSTIIST